MLLALQKQLRRANLNSQTHKSKGTSNKQKRRVETMNVEDENAIFSPLPPQDIPAKLPHKEKLLFSRIPAQQLPTFDGRESATEWWMSFVAFLTLTNIPALKAIQMLHLYLSGIALQWFTVLDPVKKSSLDIFKQAFFAQFKPSSLINTDLLSMQQQPGECVKEYFQKLSCDSTMDDSAVTKLAKKGLHHRLGVPQQPTMLDLLREKAILAEDAVEIKRSTPNTCSDLQTKPDTNASLIHTAMTSNLPASATEHRHDEEVDAVYSLRPYRERSSIHRLPRRRSFCPQYGLKEDFINDEVPCKAYKSERQSNPGGGENNIKISKIVFEYGPPELNLYKHVATKTHRLWEMATNKFILKVEGEPTDGFLVLHRDGENISEDFLNFFDFEQEGDSLPEAWIPAVQREIVFSVYLGERFWKTLNTESEEKIKNIMTGIRKSNLFIMVVTDLEKNIAIDFCKKHKVCHPSHVISPSSDKRVFYKAFYDILEGNLKIFSSDLEARAQTRNVYSIKCKLDPLIDKLQARKTKAKSNLTKQCLQKLKSAKEYGVVGYRVIGKELYVFENMLLKTDAMREKREQIKKSIQESFRGSVHFRSFHEVFKQHCAIRCGGYLQNNRNGVRGTIGMFGRLENIVEHGSMQTVAISSPHVISAGTVASIPGGERFGECIWPDNIENIHDVSVIKIDTSCLNILQTSILDERIQIGKKRDGLNDRKVFKYGAATERTEGFIEKVDDFEIYGSDVLVIVPKDSESKFSAKGDSGAIVLTRRQGQNYGIGMIYGGEFNITNSENKSIQNETIAIFLKNALDRFVNERGIAIQFDRI